MTNKKTETQPVKWSIAKNLVKLLLADKNYNTALLFASGFYFGLRIGDILNLTWGQIKKDEFSLIEGKTKKYREVNVHKEFKSVLSEVLSNMDNKHNNKDFVFRHQRSDANMKKAISVTAANKRIKKAFEKYDIKVKNPSSHTLRKTFGRRVYENNNKSEAALILLSKIFNHRDIATTRRYIGLTQEQISNAYLSL